MKSFLTFLHKKKNFVFQVHHTRVSKEKREKKFLATSDALKIEKKGSANEHDTNFHTCVANFLLRLFQQNHFFKFIKSHATSDISSQIVPCGLVRMSLKHAERFVKNTFSPIV